MTLTNLMFRHHADELTTLIRMASRLDDAQLDRPLSQGDEIPFDPHEGTLRSLLDRLIFTQEVWLAAFTGSGMPKEEGKTPVALAERHQASGEGLLRFAREAEEKGLWDSEFVDALCDPPERFTFGGVCAHILVFSAHRRQLALAALRSFGVDAGYGDPINWLRDLPLPAGE
jgi:hypothetical protein